MQNSPLEARNKLTLNRALLPLAAVAMLLAAVGPATAQTTTSTKQPLSNDARARAIVGQMTLDEKIQELHGIHSPEHSRFVPGVPRLGIGDFRITNGPAGAGPGDEPQGPRQPQANGTGPAGEPLPPPQTAPNGQPRYTPRKQAPATAFPAPIALAATWDVNMARLEGQLAADEAKDLGNSLLEGPDINIARNPENGRTFEGFGEDPYLAGLLSVANIEGIQSQSVIANVKHYAANNQETDRFVVNEIIDERTLREIYLPAFETSIKQGHSASVMCSYPRINGIYACENDFLLKQVLRKEWGFDGFVMSDFGATHSAAPAALAGLDLEMPTGIYFSDTLKHAVQSGELPMSVIDEMLVRRFRVMMDFGVFDHLPAPQPIPQQQDGEASRRIAEAGMVLLKNSGALLPLDASKLHSIAVIGPYAKAASTGGGGSSHVIALYTVAPVDGIRARASLSAGAGAAVNVTFDDGADVSQAAAAAKAADVAIVMVGDRESEGRDHPITLDGNQDALVAAVAAANPRTVVVLKSGSPMLMPWIDSVPALLEAWYPGEEDGNAVAAVLFGDVNPSGKLPITFPKALADVSANTPEQYPGVKQVVHYSEGIFVGYRHYDAKQIEPLFPFGFGLSYTSFEYKNLKISPEKISAAGDGLPVTVEFDVTNSGSVAGAEVAELYVGLPSSDAVPEPPQQLKGFAKVELKPGETSHVQLKLDARAFSYWDETKHDWAVMPGNINILVGASSRDIRLRGALPID